MSVDSSVIIRPARAVQGLVRIPGDKSISHRYAMLAAIARGTSRFHNFSAARDCASTLGCVAALGAQSRHTADGALEVTGLGPALHAPSGGLDCGNSGSTMRMLSGIQQLILQVRRPLPLRQIQLLIQKQLQIQRLALLRLTQKQILIVPLQRQLTPIPTRILLLLLVRSLILLLKLLRKHQLRILQVKL